jgi:hypothetical protein
VTKRQKRKVEIMKVRIETADLLVVSHEYQIKHGSHFERKPVPVGIHPDNKDFGTQVQECNSALDDTIYYWFSESEFAEVQEHLYSENKSTFLLEALPDEYTLILDVSDYNEPFEIKERE